MPETTPLETLNLNATIERADGEPGSPINLETGEFPVILATQGEAADGNILHIAGAKFAERIPLQIDHAPSALGTLGSITNIRATLRGRLPVLRGIGRIELAGEGDQAAIRRDLALMIANGHVRSVSVRARGEKIIPRVDLPQGHFAYVRPEDRTAKRFGNFFESSSIEEGSIVALGADKRAIIGRSLDAPVSEFWTSFLGDVETLPESIEAIRKELTETTGIAGREAVTAILNLVQEKQHDFSQVIDVRSLEKLLREVGASSSEAKRIIALCRRDSAPREVESNRPTPDQTFTVRDVQRELGALAGLREEIFRECSEMLRTALGKIH